MELGDKIIFMRNLEPHWGAGYVIAIRGHDIYVTQNEHSIGIMLQKYSSGLECEDDVLRVRAGEWGDFTKIKYINLRMYYTFFTKKEKILKEFFNDDWVRFRNHFAKDASLFRLVTRYYFDRIHYFYNRSLGPILAIFYIDLYLTFTLYQDYLVTKKKYFRRRAVSQFLAAGSGRITETEELEKAKKEFEGSKEALLKTNRAISTLVIAAITIIVSYVFFKNSEQEYVKTINELNSEIRSVRNKNERLEKQQIEKVVCIDSLTVRP